MRASGRTTRILLELAKYISDNWNKEKNVIFAADTLAYSKDLARRLLAFFDGEAFAYTYIKFGKITVRLFALSDLERQKVLFSTEWDRIFCDHYDRRYNHG